MTTRRSLILGLALALLLCGTVGLFLGRRQALSTLPPEASSISTVASPLPVPTDDTSSSSPTSPEPGPRITDSTPSSDVDEAKSPWEPTAEGFARYFTNVRGGEHAWVGRLLPLVSEEVRKYLASVDISNIPTGRYREYEVLQPGESELAVRVTYKEGWSMVLYLITDGTGWKVYRYDRFEE